MKTPIEPLTGTVRDIVENARAAGEDWGHRRPRTHEPQRATITRQLRPEWHAGDLVLVGRVRWVIQRITYGVAVLKAMNLSNVAVTWTTRVADLPQKGAAA